MSNVLKVIGIIIAIIGGLAYFGSMTTIQNDATNMGLTEYFALPHFMKSMKVLVGEVVVIGIGLTILVIGIKICRSSE